MNALVSRSMRSAARRRSAAARRSASSAPDHCRDRSATFSSNAAETATISADAAPLAGAGAAEASRSTTSGSRSVANLALSPRDELA